MCSRFFKYIVCVLFAGFLSISVKAQPGLCPPNIDFEYGDFTNWTCRTGRVALGPGGANTLTWSATGQVAGRHTIISAATAGYDLYGGFPELCPNGSGYSVKLGNNATSSQAESISYIYNIPANVPVFSIFYQYAVVLQNPDHTIEQQPRFRAKITDLSTNAPLPCVTFDFAASSSLPGFQFSPFNSQVLYKNWTPITLNLTGLAGKTIELEFTTSDCTLGGHFGYAYLDVNSSCNGAIAGSTICVGDTVINLTAPYGFQTYQWYTDNSFSQTLTQTQVLTLDPPPSIGTIFPVVVTPYPGFGCVDTLYATISISPRPVSIAGPDISVCRYQQTQIGTLSNPNYSYSWTPAIMVSNPAISNPIAWNVPPNPTEFIVKTTDLFTGCYSYDSTIVSSRQVDTSITLTGKNDYCIGDPAIGVLAVNNSATAVQWYDVSGPIPGATSIFYQPSVSGNYWAAITQNGCIDSTKNYSINIHALPQAAFTPGVDTGCVTSNSRIYTNASTVSDGSAITYLWKFSDGDWKQTVNATKTFAGTGSYTVEMVATTAHGCKDSASGIIKIFPNGVPGFLWDSICTDRPMLFTNLSNENGSQLVSYNWTFNNGDPTSSLKNPLPVTYDIPGKTDVTLKMTALGCENDSKSVTHSVLVNKAAQGIRYRDITVPTGSSWHIHVRDSVGKIYNWRPQTQLSSYNTRYTEFFAVSDDVKYMIDITDEHTCVTTDTTQMLILKKPGYYLPTAFSPNGDGLNDIATPYLIGMKALKSFSVYNRWGI